MICPHCASVIEVADEDLIVPNHYWAILSKLSDAVPSQVHCDEWLAENGYDDEMALRVARAMDNVLWYDSDRGAWYTLQADGKKERRKYYKRIILTFYNWMGRENQGLGGQRQNEQRPGRSMKVKNTGGY